MVKKHIIKLIRFIDPDDKLAVNPVHMILLLVVALPVLAMEWGVHPTVMKIFGIFIALQFLLFLMKLWVKEEYQHEMEEIKNSIPDFNLFHIIMFAIIASPVLLILYLSVSALFK